MDLIESLLDLIPKCPICFQHVFEHEIVCMNHHYLCKKCLLELNKRKRSSCPLCRQDIQITKSSHWMANFISNLKISLFVYLDVNLLDPIDYLDDDGVWRVGIFNGFDLNSRTILIDPDYYNDNNCIEIPIGKERVKKLNTMTVPWRNLSFFTYLKHIFILICQECNHIYCNHEKLWIKANIVYICKNSENLLVVYHHLDNHAKSGWFSFDSKRIKIE